MHNESLLRRLREMPGIARTFWNADRWSLTRILIRDWLGVPVKASSVEHLEAAIKWLVTASDVTRRQGIPAAYSLMEGWLPPYLETTGYCISTLYEAAFLGNHSSLAELATQLAHWEVQHQESSGGITADPGFGGIPVVFDTGQVLFGLLSAHRETGREEFLDAANKAGRFLLGSMSTDGCFSGNLYLGHVHTYNIRVSWALLLLAEQTGELSYRRGAEANVAWTLGQQEENGFFQHNTFRPGCRSPHWLDIKGGDIFRIH